MYRFHSVPNLSYLAECTEIFINTFWRQNHFFKSTKSWRGPKFYTWERSVSLALHSYSFYWFPRLFNVTQSTGDIGKPIPLRWASSGGVARTQHQLGDVWNVGPGVSLSLSPTKTDLHLRSWRWSVDGTYQRFSRNHFSKSEQLFLLISKLSQSMIANNQS